MVDLKAKPFYLTEKEIQWVEETRNGMTLEEKVGQLFLIMYPGNREAVEKLSQEGIKPGGYLLRNAKVEQIRETIAMLQDSASIPLLIAGDLERGAQNMIEDGTSYGCQMAIAAANDSEIAYRAGLCCGSEAAAVGVNWDFGPIVDIDYNYHNPITNIRTFGSNPERVMENARALAKGLRDGGIIPCMKHWPGDGRDERDQHFLASINDCTVEEWDATYGKIYQAMIEDGTETLMTAHIMLPSYSRFYNPDIKDEEILPGSLNADLHNKLLRGKLGFNGLIITDATTMAGFTEVMPRSQAVPASIANGADMFLFTHCMEEDYGYMLEGVKNGVISPERLNEAITRILALKAKWKLPEKKAAETLVPGEENLSIFREKKGAALAEEIADKSITLVKDTQHLLPINPEKQKRIYLVALGDEPNYHNGKGGYAEYFAQKLEEKGFQVKRYNPDEKPYEYGSGKMEAFLKKYDMVIYFANVTTRNNDSAARISWPGERRDTVPCMMNELPILMVSVDNPYHLVDAPRIRTYVNAYTSSEVVIDKLVEKLLGESEFQGVSPIDPFCGVFNAKY